MLNKIKAMTLAYMRWCDRNFVAVIVIVTVSAIAQIIAHIAFSYGESRVAEDIIRECRATHIEKVWNLLDCEKRLNDLPNG